MKLLRFLLILLCAVAITFSVYTLIQQGKVKIGSKSYVYGAEENVSNENTTQQANVQTIYSNEVVKDHVELTTENFLIKNPTYVCNYADRIATYDNKDFNYWLTSDYSFQDDNYYFKQKHYENVSGVDINYIFPEDFLKYNYNPSDEKYSRTEGTIDYKILINNKYLANFSFDINNRYNDGSYTISISVGVYEIVLEEHLGKYLYTMYSGVNYYDKLSAKENGFKSSSESWMNSKTIVAEKWTEPLMFKLNNKKLTASFMDFNQQLELPEEVKTLNVIQTYYTNKDAEKLTETPFKLWTNYTVYSNEYDVEKYKVEFVDADGTLIKTYLVNKGEQLTEVPLIDTNCYWTDSYLINQPIKCNLKFYKQKINDAPIVSYKPNFELDESNIKAVKLTNYEGFNTFNVRLRNAGFTKTYELSEENLSINLFDRLQEIYPASHLYWITYSEQVFEFQAISEDGKSQWFSFNYEFKKISEELNIDIEKEMSDEWKNAFNQVSDQVVDGFTGYLETIIGVYKYTFEFVNGVVVDYFKVFVDLGQVATDPEKGFFEKLIDGTTGFFNDIGTLFTKGRIGDLSLGDLIKGILTGNASKINYNTTTKVISIIFYCLFGIAVFCVLTWAFKKVKEKNNG